MRAHRFHGAETGLGHPVWIIVQHVRCVVWDDQRLCSNVFIGPGPDDHVPINLKPDEVMSRLGFNDGGD